MPIIKTLSDIESALAEAGATTVTKKYDGTGMPVAMEFDIQTKFGMRSIRLPANVPAIYRILDPGTWLTDSKKIALQQRASRVAWRIMLRWVEAQLALIETEMVDLSEVLLPYMIMDGERTTYQIMLNRQLLMPGTAPEVKHE